MGFPGRRVPTSTYRLQITEDFDLVAAARTLAYLHELGVDWVYLSPLLASESGSEHGYDVSDHRAIDPSRGRSSGLAALASEAKRLGMGVLVDIVPNHVGVARPWENEWWWQVLTHGQASPYASAFDIDWDAGGGRLRIPVVADEDLLDPPSAGTGGSGRIDHLQVLGGELHYRDQRFPLAPDTAHGAHEDPNAVHARQHYELVSWREADRTLNYRRFFAVNTLVAIRVEDTEWFERSHAEIRRWFDEDLVDGLRVDHPDGLRDPGKYLDDLARLTGGGYVLVEKILGLDEGGDGEGVRLEELPTNWATAGTTGYDAMAIIDRVLVDPAGEAPLTQLENKLRGREVDWPALVHDGKLAVAAGMLNSEVRRIAREVLAAVDPSGWQPDLEALSEAIAELLADFEVYRSYLPEGREHLERAFEYARTHRPDLGPVFALLHPVLTDGASAPAQRFQQTSGMVMAKGVEDGAFYRWARLTSLNEVGGDPGVFAVSAADFHTLMAQRQTQWPYAMTAGTTHDTKRGEDVRARISVLAEVPRLWTDALERLLELVPLPDPGFANLLWQAIVGVWPAERDRLAGYAEKAMREAGDRTSWTKPDAEYEAAVLAAVDAANDSAEVRTVLQGVVDAIAPHGWSNALAAKLLDLTVPGVPDLYQGSELWELSLVDPDNRRPVDFAARASLLAKVRTGARPPLPSGLDDGAAKLLLCHQALTLRRDRPELFAGYSPLVADGPAADHLLAFDRGGAISVATRLPVGLAANGGWRDTALPLPEGRWRDLISGRAMARDEHGVVRVAELLDQYPVALLVHDEHRPGARGRFEVWAPAAERVRLVAGDRVVAMAQGTDGWWRPAEPEPLGRIDYGFLVDDRSEPLPDPRSRWQPHGVHGLSRTFEPSEFSWHDAGWTGRQLAGGLIYELHVGTFTPEGTLEAAISRLPQLVELGVDFVELMPVNAFNGEHGWGYDGVAWFAVHEPYGGPDAYRRFVDAAHALGLAVIQDVVYNHLGPSGNYLPVYGPYLSAQESSWGTVLNLDGEGSGEVRRYITDNVRFWFTDMHVDGLRLDAVHALVDESAVHLLEEIAVVTASASAQLRRPLTLIAESEGNDPRLVRPREAGGHGIDAQWNDDFHHALHTALTGETDGYYATFGSLGSLAAACERGFFRESVDGTALDVETMPGWRLVANYSNHDQIGNRATGDRLAHSLDDDQLASAALLTLTTSATPMLFQGEEWGASTPFPYFSSHPEPELAEAIREGRLTEFAPMSWDPETVVDPQDAATFASAKLDWDEARTGRHAVILGVHRELVSLRRELPELSDPAMTSTTCTWDDTERWFLMRRGGIAVAVNFSDAEVRVELGRRHQLRWTTPAGAYLDAGSVVLPPHAAAVLLPVE
ncbi:MAG TPA: malto-oligosyltrehalose synthase [Propionicimonas sp.]|nr:malto-oligosyltrehalose synthase [Propionicimonas sp.]